AAKAGKGLGSTVTRRSLSTFRPDAGAPYRKSALRSNAVVLPVRRTVASVDNSTLSFSGTKSSTENSTRPTGAPFGSMRAETDHRPRRDDFGMSIAWYSAPEAGRATV